MTRLYLSVIAFMMIGLYGCDKPDAKGTDHIKELPQINKMPAPQSAAPQIESEKLQAILQQIRREQYNSQEKFKGYAAYFMPHLLETIDVEFEPAQSLRSFDLPMNAGKTTLTIPGNWYIGKVVKGDPRSYGTAFIPTGVTFDSELLGLSFNTAEAYVSMYSNNGAPNYEGLPSRDFFNELDLDKLFSKSKCKPNMFCDITPILIQMNPMWERNAYPKSWAQINTKQIQIIRTDKAANFDYIIKFVNTGTDYDIVDDILTCNRSDVCFQIIPKSKKSLTDTALLSTIGYLDQAIH